MPFGGAEVPAQIPDVFTDCMLEQNIVGTSEFTESMGTVNLLAGDGQGNVPTGVVCSHFSGHRSPTTEMNPSPILSDIVNKYTYTSVKVQTKLVTSSSWFLNSQGFLYPLRELYHYRLEYGTEEGTSSAISESLQTD